MLGYAMRGARVPTVMVVAKFLRDIPGFFYYCLMEIRFKY